MRTTHSASVYLVATLMTMAAAREARAEVLHVPQAYATIQAAIDAAAEGDVVLIADGTNTGDGNKDLDTCGKRVTIRSASGDPTRCVIDCERIGRGFSFHSGEKADTVVEAVTIVRGDSSLGGGIFCQHSSPTLDRCIIQDCQATGMDSHMGYGGGIYAIDSSLTVRDCRIIGNRTTLFMVGGDGGGLCLMLCDNAKLTNCTISENRTIGRGSNGGGLYLEGSSPTIAGCVITNNVAEQHGIVAPCGGVRCGWRSAPMLVNCTISGNTGAGVVCAFSDENRPSLLHCTIVGNEGGGYAGLTDIPCQITNCILWGNTPAEIQTY